MTSVAFTRPSGVTLEEKHSTWFSVCFSTDEGIGYGKLCDAFVNQLLDEKWSVARHWPHLHHDCETAIRRDGQIPLTTEGRDFEYCAYLTWLIKDHMLNCTECAVE